MYLLLQFPRAYSDSRTGLARSSGAPAGCVGSPAGERATEFRDHHDDLNELSADMQNRMPVILKPGTWPAWLGEEPADNLEAGNLARMAWRGACRCLCPEGNSGAMPNRQDDAPAGEPARREFQKLLPEPNRASTGCGR